MDIRQLRYFLVIAEEGQISRAAEKLHMSQPPLSQQLRLMEEELGTTLLERKRNGKSMELTETGKVFYEKAQEVLNLFEESILEVKEVTEGIRGSLSFGVVPSCVSYLPQKIQDFNKAYPNISFRIWGGDPYEIRKHLENRDIELAIIRLPIESKDLSIVHIGKEPFVLVIPNDWETFHSKESITLKEIGNIPLLLMHRTKGGGIYETIIEEFNRINMKPNILCECPDVNILLSLIASNIGAGILPKTSIPPSVNKGIRVLDIKDTPLQSETALVWLKERYLSKAASRFIELFK
ncbi:DNA-binding transcriptional LysR family regulator [Bacillus pakistanensis]|uniref:DNA-binding transcriptional LysR family regulator n=1 Tax=Rossellomorea pakistanensis TaxID=992288 RepID=A0ABS2N6J9_9BACI|nr:LysR family transcriptional regulator [Bacillus pakistanensis]MBM7583468.1 DNA-binding transcriptional LysR family regulator [Bacillus pakistanensis]